MFSITYLYEGLTLLILISSPAILVFICSIVGQIAPEGWGKTAVNGSMTLLTLFLTRASISRTHNYALDQMIGDLTDEQLAEKTAWMIKRWFVAIPTFCASYGLTFLEFFLADIWSVLKDIKQAIYTFIEWCGETLADKLKYVWDAFLHYFGELFYFLYDRAWTVVGWIGEALGYQMGAIVEMAKQAGRFVFLLRDNIYEAAVQWYSQGHRNTKFFFVVVLMMLVTFILGKVLIWAVTSFWEAVKERQWYLSMIGKEKLTGSV